MCEGCKERKIIQHGAFDDGDMKEIIVKLQSGV